MAKSRKASSRKGSRKAHRKASGSRRAVSMKGGKRAMSGWNKSVKRVYEEMKRKDASVKFGDALKEASKRKKAGTL